MNYAPPPTPFVPYRWVKILMMALVAWALILGTMCLTGCAVAPAAVTADIPVAVPIDCHKPDPGPVPDLTVLAALKPGDTPQQVLQAVSDALATLAQDDRRLRALMGQ